jgi:hypothetical protein
MGLIKDIMKYRASKGKGQIAPKVRDPAKVRKLKPLPRKRRKL